MTERLSGLRHVTGSHEGILCDVWGVLHNGVAVYEAAAEALSRFRKAGGHVVMITNSPRPSKGVIAQFNQLGVSNDVYDAVVTSGDVTRDLIAQAQGPVFHLGPDRDRPLFDGLNVEFAGPDEAQVVVCTGLFDDENETPEDYRERLQLLVNRDVPFICANPDIVVERGDRMIWCAGALARLYGEMGGQTRLAGKPHRPIYDLATRTMTGIAGREIPIGELLAIGDGMLTDVAGALAFGSPLLYISGGIHAGEYGGAESPDEAALLAFLETHNASADFWMPRLEW